MNTICSRCRRGAPRRQAAGVNRLGTVEGRQRVEHRSGQHIAARRRPVFQDTVVEQVNRPALEHAQQRRRAERAIAAQAGIQCAGRVAAAGFGKPDELGQFGITHIVADFALRGEQRLGREAAELEAAALWRQAGH